MIFRILAMILQLLAFTVLVYVTIGLFNRKKKQVRREEILDEHSEKLKDKQLKRQLRGGKNNEQK